MGNVRQKTEDLLKDINTKDIHKHHSGNNPGNIHVYNPNPSQNAIVNSITTVSTGYAITGMFNT
ncbi:MAG: hypothetical protein ACP5M9_00210 [Candidatus Micrarchaeia archaeon]